MASPSAKRQRLHGEGPGCLAPTQALQSLPVEPTGANGVAVRLRSKLISGEKLPEISVLPLLNIGGVKERLSHLARTPAQHIRLLFGDRSLDDDERTVAQEQLPPVAELSLVRCLPEAASLLGIVEDDPLMVPFLADCGADVNESDDAGWTALHWAAYNNQTNVALALLANSSFVELNAQDTGGMTALHLAATRGLATVCGALANHPDFEVLNRRSANGNTALHWAARSSQAAVCEILLDSKRFTAVNEQNVHGWTALHYAAAAGLLPVCKKLLEHSEFSATKQLTNNGETALHWAVLHAKTEICELLHGHIDVAIQDVEGHSAIDWARSHGREIICMLLQNNKCA
mmetsp:Transcript_136503/g.265526  ORF Transcript_136503/g.265526 Transcript_136503/m.265526 type:complete len:346 (-) Transcript_136503:8-1045(-)